MWVLSCVSKISFGSDFSFRQSLKLLWKELPLNVKFDQLTYEPLLGIPETDMQFIRARLVKTNQSLPSSIRSSIDEFRTSFLYLE